MKLSSLDFDSGYNDIYCDDKQNSGKEARLPSPVLAVMEVVAQVHAVSGAL